MKRRLVAALACRNQGSRLYGKPMQNLDEFSGVKIIDNIIDCLKKIDVIDEIILGISEGKENEIFCEIAKEKKLSYIIGDKIDVLQRLIQCGEISNATDIFRMTSESPFLYFEAVNQAWSDFLHQKADALFLDDIVDGCGFEIIGLDTLKLAHKKGSSKHRSELCSLYLRENVNDFNITRIRPPKELVRKDLRLTVDNPEDLVICRKVYKAFAQKAPLIPVLDIVKFLDKNPDLINLTYEFTELGYESMNIWKNNE